MAPPIVRTISRYLLRQHVAPLGFALAALTSLMLIQQIAKQLSSLLGKGLPTSVIIEVFLLSVPFIVAVTLPMAVLVAVLHVFTRLAGDNERSEEHTSELQSRSDLVCRLLLEKKKQKACHNGPRSVTTAQGPYRLLMRLPAPTTLACR